MGIRIPKRQVTLLYGPPASGKSLFCLSACNSSPSSCYIDARSHLSAFSLLKRPSKTLIYRPNSFVEFELAIDRAARCRFPLLLIDSFTRFYLNSLSKSNYPSYNNALASLLPLLSSYARREDAAVILTTGIAKGNPIGGALFDNIPVRIRLDVNSLHLEKHPLKEPSSVPFHPKDLLS